MTDSLATARAAYGLTDRAEDLDWRAGPAGARRRSRAAVAREQILSRLPGDPRGSVAHPLPLLGELMIETRLNLEAIARGEVLGGGPPVRAVAPTSRASTPPREARERVILNEEQLADLGERILEYLVARPEGVTTGDLRHGVGQYGAEKRASYAVAHRLAAEGLVEILNDDGKVVGFRAIA